MDYYIDLYMCENSSILKPSLAGGLVITFLNIYMIYKFLNYLNIRYSRGVDNMKFGDDL